MVPPPRPPPKKTHPKRDNIIIPAQHPLCVGICELQLQSWWRWQYHFHRGSCSQYQSPWIKFKTYNICYNNALQFSISASFFLILSRVSTFIWSLKPSPVFGEMKMLKLSRLLLLSPPLNKQSKHCTWTRNSYLWNNMRKPPHQSQQQQTGI